MPSSWHILADDLTGALDTAAAWSDRESVPVFLDVPGQSHARIQVVSTGTRDVDPRRLPDLLAPCLDWLTTADRAFKKIDSLLRGNTFAEIAWLLGTRRFAGAVLVPAFPAQGRYTAQGRHWVAPPRQPDGPRSHEHPQTLVQSLSGVGLQAQLVSDAAACLEGSGQVLVPDVLEDSALDRLAALARSPRGKDWLWCGSAGLAWALARQDTDGAKPPPARPDRPTSRPEPRIMLVTASRHPVLREQWLHLPPGDDRFARFDLADPHPLSREEAQRHLSEKMQNLVRHHPRPDTLLVVGGDTLLALCQAAHIETLLAGPGPRPGWGSATLIGGPWDGLVCHSRSGAFGPPDDLAALVTDLMPPAPDHH